MTDHEGDGLIVRPGQDLTIGRVQDVDQDQATVELEQPIEDWSTALARIRRLFPLWWTITVLSLLTILGAAILFG